MRLGSETILDRVDRTCLWKDISVLCAAIQGLDEAGTCSDDSE